jgi:signal transduction histidine kinase
MENGRYREALPGFERALAIAQRHELNPKIQSFYQALSDCYRYTGQMRKALEYQERAYLMERHIFNEERLRSIDELEIRYQTTETEKRLALAENENLLKARQLLQHRWALTLLTAGLLFAILVILLYRQQKKATRLLALQEQAQHQYTLRQLQQEKEFDSLQALFKGQEHERRRIAHDLHDSLGGILYALGLQLSSQTAEALSKARNILDTAIAENHRISQDLVPAALARLGPIAALREWKAQFEKMYELPAQLDLPENLARLPEHIETNLFRIAQELMLNTAKHAYASRLAVHLIPGDRMLTLIVEDDGTGFDVARQSPGFLKTVYSRTQLIRGQIQIDSAPGKGTAVMVEIPLTTE